MVDFRCFWIFTSGRIFRKSDISDPLKFTIFYLGIGLHCSFLDPQISISIIYHCSNQKQFNWQTFFQRKVYSQSISNLSSVVIPALILNCTTYFTSATLNWTFSRTWSILESKRSSGINGLHSINSDTSAYLEHKLVGNHRWLKKVHKITHFVPRKAADVPYHNLNNWIITRQISGIRQKMMFSCFHCTLSSSKAIVNRWYLQHYNLLKMNLDFLFHSFLFLFHPVVLWCKWGLPCIRHVKYVTIFFLNSKYVFFVVYWW